MLFDSPIPFADALASRKVKALLPTELSSGELAKIGPDILDYATFSARTSNAELLQSYDNLIADLLNPHTETRDGKPYTAGIDPATARLQIKQKLEADGYAPLPEDAGTIKDLASDARVNLVLNMGVQTADGYGAWRQSQDEDVLDAFPAQELFRLEARKEPRQWLNIWRSCGGPITEGGRMIALVNDPVWLKISDFGHPYPPFKFGSGMWTRPISREMATDLGLITDDVRITPDTRRLTDNLQASPALRSQGIIDALVGLGYQFVEGVLSL